MTCESDGDLPLHDEAKARSEWRGGETLLDKGDPGGSGPASEIDDASQDGQSPEDDALGGLARRPPD